MNTRLLNSDINEALALYPSLTRVERNGSPWVVGKLDIADDKGNILQTFDVTIGFPADYPYRYPRVTENEEKIRREADFHVNSDNTLCMAAHPIEIVNCVGGITLSWFIKEKLIPHLGAQEYRRRYGAYPWGEMPHGKLGIRQAYKELCGTSDWGETMSIMQHVIKKDLPGRNDPCFCGCDCKFKQCHHYKSVVNLSKIGGKKLAEDLLLIND